MPLWQFRCVIGRGLELSWYAPEGRRMQAARLVGCLSFFPLQIYFGFYHAWGLWFMLEHMLGSTNSSQLRGTVLSGISASLGRFEKCRSGDSPVIVSISPSRSVLAQTFYRQIRISAVQLLTENPGAGRMASDTPSSLPRAQSWSTAGEDWLEPSPQRAGFQRGGNAVPRHFPN